MIHMTYTYDLVPTPFGDALAVFSAEGLTSFTLTEAEHPHVPWLLESVSRRLGTVPDAAPDSADALAALIARYFDGEPINFGEHIAFDWRLTHGFVRNTLQEICRIPWGETATYGEIAASIGHPGAARAVGSACRNSPFSIVVPVHRVVRANGAVGQYGAYPERKRFMLDLEARLAIARTDNSNSLGTSLPRAQ